MKQAKKPKAPVVWNTLHITVLGPPPQKHKNKECDAAIDDILVVIECLAKGVWRQRNKKLKQFTLTFD